MKGLPAHSPLGASGAYRWMKCPGSVVLSQGVQDEESEHAALGTAAHALAENCLRTGQDAWEWIGIDGVTGSGLAVDKEMADAVQVYLDAVRRWHPERDQGNFWVERPFHCPSLHDLFYGRSDATYHDAPARTLHGWDYKHGAGIIVEVERNPQLMYYMCGMLTDLDLWSGVDKVVLHVAQPRGWHWDGPVRQWSCSTAELSDWLVETLLPAMNNALVSRETASGEHCRFCPARSMACPQLMKDMTELEEMMALIEGKSADQLSHAQVARFLELFDVAKIVKTAAEKTAYNRLQAGQVIPGYKLANKRANRQWKDGAEKAIKAKFGADAYTKPELLSPAQIEALPEGEALAARWAEKPAAGLTVVKDTDVRPGVSKNTKSLFTPVKKGKK